MGRACRCAAATEPTALLDSAWSRFVVGGCLALQRDHAFSFPMRYFETHRLQTD
jgi:hypothetical protein